MKKHYDRHLTFAKYFITLYRLKIYVKNIYNQKIYICKKSFTIGLPDPGAGVTGYSHVSNAVAAGLIGNI